MSEKEIAHVARQVRVRKVWSVLSGMLMGLGLAAIGFFNENADLALWGISSRVFQLVICAVMLGLGVFMVALWRCPVCKKSLGLARLPLRCPHCGAVLRDQERR